MKKQRLTILEGEKIFKKINLKQLFKIIGITLTIISFIYLGMRLKNINVTFREININFITGLFLILAIVIASFTTIMQSFNYNFALRFFSEEKVNVLVSANIYIKSNIYKYLPGNVMHYIGRNAFGASLGMSQKDLSLSTFVEIGMGVITPVLWVMLLSFDDLKSIFKGYIDPKFILLIGIIVLIILLFVIISKRVNEFVDLRRFFTTDFFITILKMFIIGSFTFFIQGILLLFIFKILFMTSFNLTESIFIISSYMLSWSVGFITPGVPGGIGVKETVLLELFKSIYTNESIIIISLLVHRIILISSDFISYIMFVLYKEIKEKKDNNYNKIKENNI